MEPCVDALKEWAGKANATIIYDSTVDEFTDDGLFNKVKGKPNIAVIGFTTDGDVFGGFYHMALMRQGQHLYDPNLFIFSFESHGQSTTPHKFVVKKEKKGCAVVKFQKNHPGGLFAALYVAHDSGFLLGNDQSEVCFAFEPSGFECTGNTTPTGKNFGVLLPCCRLVAIQLR